MPAPIESPRMFTAVRILSLYFFGSNELKEILIASIKINRLKNFLTEKNLLQISDLYL
jgi:hypothetical protein